MGILIFAFICYLAAGIVFITREADLQVIETGTSSQDLQHPVLRLVAGMIMMLLWPAFLLSEIFEPQQTPMAVRIKDFNC